jgi:hypothetical protein
MAKKKYVRVNVQENGRRGGLARGAKLSPAKRKAAASKAVNVRWDKYYREHPEKTRPKKRRVA